MRWCREQRCKVHIKGRLVYSRTHSIFSKWMKISYSICQQTWKNCFCRIPFHLPSFAPCGVFKRNCISFVFFLFFGVHSLSLNRFFYFISLHMLVCVLFIAYLMPLWNFVLRCFNASYDAIARRLKTIHWFKLKLNRFSHYHNCWICVIQMFDGYTFQFSSYRSI